MLSYAGPVLAGVLLLRLWFEGLLGRYRFFAIYLFFLVGEIIVLLTVRQGSNRYFRVYVAFDAALWIAQILMILEMFTLLLKQYPGIARQGRRFVVFAFGAAAVVSFAFTAMNPESGSGQYPWVDRYLLISRVVAFTVLAFFVLLLGFLFWFPIPLSRNVVGYTVGFSIYFAVRPLTRLAGNLSPAEYLVLLSCISELIVIACLTFWIFALTRRGESVDVTVGHRWQPGESESLIQQLESINAVLLRTARK